MSDSTTRATAATEKAAYSPVAADAWWRRFPWVGMLVPGLGWSGYWLWEHCWQLVAVLALVNAVVVWMYYLGYTAAGRQPGTSTTGRSDHG